MTNLTQMPDPRLDGITRETLERELRGAIHLARQRLAEAQAVSDKAVTRSVERHLIELLRRAREEGVDV